MSIFEDTKNIFTGRDFELSNPYMINRLLSFLPETFTLSATTNRYLSRIPVWALKAIYKNCVRKRRADPWLYYERAKKKEEPLLTQKVATELCCSTLHAQQTIKVLRKWGHKPETFFGLKKGE